MILPLLVSAVLTGVGVAVGWINDDSRLTATLLLLEPLLLVLGIWAATIARWRGASGVSLGISFGLVGATLAVRLPYPTVPPELSPPEWTDPVHRCASAIDMPVDPVRVLQWTLDGAVTRDDVLATVRAAQADVVVLHRVTNPTLFDEVAEAFGGESRLRGAEGGATGILASGGFHPCGGASEWTDPEAADTSVQFVGVPPDTIFPLVVTRIQSAMDADAGRAASLRQTLSVLSGIQGASTVVVADAPGPRSSRDLSLEFGRIGLASLPVPPTWPARMGVLPLLTVHPFTRVWVGPIWRVVRAQRASARVGLHAPVVIELAGPVDVVAPAPAEPRRKLDEPAIEEAPAEE